MELESSWGYRDNLSQLYWIHIGWLCSSQLLLLPAVLNQSWFLSSTNAPYNADSVLLKQDSLIIAHSFGSISLITCLSPFCFFSVISDCFISNINDCLLLSCAIKCEIYIKCEIHSALWFFLETSCRGPEKCKRVTFIH